MSYASITDIRNITGITTSDVDDSTLSALGTFASYQLNRDLNVRVVREPIGFIDNTRQNDIDSSNTTYYVRNWKRYIADSNDDQEVTTSDITVYEVNSDGTETTKTVSSITPDSGKFIMASAPVSGRNYYVTYEYSNVSEYTPDPLIKLAHAMLTASFAYSRMSIGKYKNLRIGAISITLDSTSFKAYYDRYAEIIAQINNDSLAMKGDYPRIV